MCGIFGEWRFDDAGIVAAEVQAATATLRHRGPDDEGYLVGRRDGTVAELRRGNDSVVADAPPIQSPLPIRCDVAFGFRRLAILDLTAGGRQPMRSADGAHWIVYNGEVYNYVELRHELAALGHTFRSTSDTEVILAAYRQWGTGCLERFNGMWAFVIWDVPARRLFGARDRLGIKPLFFAATDRAFTFGSEIKAIAGLPRSAIRFRDEAIADFLATGLVDHSARTFYEGIESVPAAHYFVVDGSGVTIRRYWDVAAGEPGAIPDGEAIDRVRGLFDDAVRLHLRSDVPIGSCLSGGIDSSAIVCVANRLLRRNATGVPQQETFSSCFEDPRFDERPFIEHVLAQTGARRNFVFPRGEDLPRDIAAVLWHHDEPFASTSVYAQWKVMQAAAARGVKVILDGQGGDELFAGYHTYFGFHFADLLRRRDLRTLWREARGYSRVHGVSIAVAFSRLLEPLLGPALRRVIRTRIKDEGVAISREFLRARGDETATVRGGDGTLFERLCDLLTRSSLPALLRYEDRDSMAFSVEARVPFLDVRLVELAFALPARLKISGGMTKVALREALRGVLPDPVRVRTDKMGFVTPETAWLRGPLRSWATDILHSSEFRSRPFFDHAKVREYFKKFLDGHSDRSGPIWRWIVLELWLRQADERRARAAA